VRFVRFVVKFPSCFSTSSGVAMSFGLFGDPRPLLVWDRESKSQANGIMYHCPGFELTGLSPE
jgi:hypothetical protein